MTSADSNGVELEVGDEVLFAGNEYTIQDIVLDPKQEEYCTAELAEGVRAYCNTMTKIDY